MADIGLEFLLKLIYTSQAIYANLSVPKTLEEILVTAGKFGGADFTEQEAGAFVDRYEISAPMASSASGFQSILFHDKIDNTYVLAIRGSEQFLQDFVWADGGNIGDYGYAASQSLDLYRYWKQLHPPPLG